MPQPKKHPSTRARRNKASTAAVLPAGSDVAGAIMPELVDRPIGWHPMAAAWWVAVWRSPMHHEWHFETDLHNVYMAVMHYHDVWCAETPSERQKATASYDKAVAKLGLTPYDRRRLEWTIATATTATRTARRAAERQEPVAPTEVSTKSDPRSVLTVVS